MVIPLSHTISGDQGRIIWVASCPQRKQRLSDLGFLPDALVTSGRKLPHGVLGFYQIHGNTIPLRRKTANEIFIELEVHQKHGAQDK